MSSEDTSSTILELIKDFEIAAAEPKSNKHLSPFSMRLTPEERTYLDEHCGRRPWAAYIRECVFGENATKRKTARRPRIEDKEISAALSGLGQSRLASNVNQLAKSANMGTLDISDETDRQLQEAAQAVLAMRDALFVALGMKVDRDQ
jgi:hypothetical protein